MKSISKKIVYWSPRILSIAFILFLALFALDVFKEYSGWNIIPALFIHLLPSLVLIVFIIIAWKYDLIGTAVFLTMAIFYVLMVGIHHHWSWYASISGPSAVIGTLYFISWFQKRSLKKTSLTE
jgi:cell division protein FtsW (lipid II flippase)